MPELADKIKVNTFLNAIGKEAVEVFDTFELPAAQKGAYIDVVRAFEAFCSPKKNTVYERFTFYQRKQRDGKIFDSFLIDIKRLVRTCEFKLAENEMLRDQIVMGVGDKKLQTRLLENAPLTYEIAVEKARANEAMKEQSSAMNKTVPVNVMNAYAQHTQNSLRHRRSNGATTQIAVNGSRTMERTAAAASTV